MTFTWVAWASEGFEYGLWSLLRDPGTWVWLLALAMGGPAFGLVWHASRPEVSP